MLLAYARGVGVALVVIGSAGMLGVGTTSPAVDSAYLLIGSLFAYVGFGRVDKEFGRGMVGGLGAINLLGFLLDFAAHALFGFASARNGTTMLLLVNLVVGALSIAAWRLSRRGPRTTPRASRRP